jgi:hypothetical protein
MNNFLDGFISQLSHFFNKCEKETIKKTLFRCFFIVGDEYDLWDRQDIFNQIKEGSLLNYRSS